MCIKVIASQTWDIFWDTVLKLQQQQQQQQQQRNYKVDSSRNKGAFQM